MLHESRYIQWNEEVREKQASIWQLNCLAAFIFCVRMIGNWELFEVKTWPIAVINLAFSSRLGLVAFAGTHCRIAEYGRMRT